MKKLAAAVLIFKRTLRHYPPLALATLITYFSYWLLTEPGWLIWNCTAMAATGFLLNLMVIAANGGQMPAAVDPADLEHDWPDPDFCTTGYEYL